MGSVIGEKALLENSPRAASIITNEESEFLILQKNVFLKICENFRQQINLKNNFLK